MKFKLDENLPSLAVNVFKESGFDAVSVKDQGLCGCNDDHLIDVCLDEVRVLVTLDLDFSDIRRYQPSLLNGIIILKTNKQTRDHVIMLLKRIIPFLSTENITGRLVIVEEDKIRIR